MIVKSPLKERAELLSGSWRHDSTHVLLSLVCELTYVTVLYANFLHIYFNSSVFNRLIRLITSHFERGWEIQKFIRNQYCVWLSTSVHIVIFVQVLVFFLSQVILFFTFNRYTQIWASQENADLLFVVIRRTKKKKKINTVVHFYLTTTLNVCLGTNTLTWGKRFQHSQWKDSLTSHKRLFFLHIPEAFLDNKHQSEVYCRRAGLSPR